MGALRSGNKVVLLHQDEILHYRVAIYNYLSEFLRRSGYQFSVISGGVDKHNPHPIEFSYFQARLTTFSLISALKMMKPDAVIFFVNLKNLYLFPLILWCRIKGIKVIYWGHGIDQGDKQARFKNFLYRLEHRLADALILYGPQLRKYVAPRWHSKSFIANNTLNLSGLSVPVVDRTQIRKKYGISTSRNIVLVGRLQKRKGFDLLFDAMKLIGDPDVGLVIVGSKHDSDIDFSRHENVYLLGSLFGEELAQLMVSMDVYCMPKWVGLSIIDAFYFGLPMVTMDVDHPPEIMYLKDGINGFIVPENDVSALADRLRLLLRDDALRQRMSAAARQEIQENGSMDRMCEGFRQAIAHCIGEKSAERQSID
jgi:glycosyltransferase involved in cell wall biosynthesis